MKLLVLIWVSGSEAPPGHWSCGFPPFGFGTADAVLSYYRLERVPVCVCQLIIAVACGRAVRPLAVYEKKPTDALSVGWNGSILPDEWVGGDPWFPEDRSLQYFTVRWWA